jgi:hypothetical protein
MREERRGWKHEEEERGGERVEVGLDLRRCWLLVPRRLLIRLRHIHHICEVRLCQRERESEGGIDERKAKERVTEGGKAKEMMGA